jgi:hypothetical protein
MLLESIFIFQVKTFYESPGGLEQSKKYPYEANVYNANNRTYFNNIVPKRMHHIYTQRTSIHGTVLKYKQETLISQNEHY